MTTTTSAAPAVSAVLPSHGAPPSRVERVPVVVAIEADGLVRVFGPDQVDVRFVGLLDTLPENRTDAEEYAKLRLPIRYKEIAFDARYSRGIFWPCRRTPEEELNRVIALTLVRECRQ